MPTGYTAPIEDLSKPYSFSEYVWECARAFDIWSRDNDGPLPLERKPDIQYDTERVEKIKAELAELSTVSDEVLQAKLDAQYEERVTYWEKERTQSVAIHARHVQMKAKVEAWVPPTELHQNLKKFMLDQLNVGYFNHQYTPSRPERRMAGETRAASILDLQEDLVRSERRIQQEIARAKERNDWTKALYESVPRP